MIKLKRRGRYWWFFCTIQGRRIRQSTGETKRERAELVAQSQMLKLKDHSIDAIFLKAPTLKQFSEEFLQWVESCSLDHDTKRYYTNGWRLLSQTSLAHMRMNEIANVHCELAQFPGSSYSANTALRTLRRMFSVARELRRIASVPRIALREETPRAIAMDEAAAAQIAGRMTGGAGCLRGVARHRHATKRSLPPPLGVFLVGETRLPQPIREDEHVVADGSAPGRQLRHSTPSLACKGTTTGGLGVSFEESAQRPHGNHP
jgi:hypothetical protein